MVYVYQLHTSSSRSRVGQQQGPRPIRAYIL